MNTQEILNIIRDRCELHTAEVEDGFDWSSEVHLEHLLLAFSETDSLCTYYPQSSGLLLIQQEDQNRNFSHFDLSKSVEQNLEDNPELRELVANLLKTNAHSKSI